jgi:hypothetical protein
VAWTLFTGDTAIYFRNLLGLDGRIGSEDERLHHTLKAPFK